MIGKILIAAGLAMLVTQAAEAQQHFNFTEQTSDGVMLTGGFDGTLSGNLITGLSHISLAMDGIAFPGSGSLFGSHWDSSQGWVSGGAVASLDGTGNNFLFIDTDYPNDTNYHAYFYSVVGVYEDYGQNNISGQTASNSGGANNFTAVPVPVPEPVSWALMVAGFGLAGAALRRRRGISVRFA